MLIRFCCIDRNEWNISRRVKSIVVKEGNGITGLRERLAAIGGSLTTQQTDGFSAAIELPLQESA